MKFLFSFSLLFFVSPLAIWAQCDRYQEEVFPNSMLTSVVYSDVHALSMDVYMPEGDTIFHRPCLLFAHSGQFFGGSKSSDPVTVEFCIRFAKMGYVCCAVDYRLATIGELMDTTQALTAITRAVNDLKAAVRYMRRDGETTHVFGIDPNQIFIGGNEAGAVLANQMAFVDNLSEVPAYHAEIINTNGGIEGNSGNPGYSSDVNGVINWGGALNSVNCMSSDDEDLFSAHGDSDQVVDFWCNEALHSSVGTTSNTLWLCGSGSMHDYAQSIGMSSRILRFNGDGTQPWNSDGDKMDSVVEQTAEWLYERIDCEPSTGIQPKDAVRVKIAPNPFEQQIHISGELAITELHLYDLSGRLLWQREVHAKTIHLEWPQLPVGMYQLQIRLENGQYLQQRILKTEKHRF